MRLTTDELLVLFPSLNMSGKNYDRVQGEYYGDIGKLQKKHVDTTAPKTCQNLEAVDCFVSAMYPDDDVYKYMFCHGDGFTRVDKDGNEHFICGTINTRWNSKSPYGAYELCCFNNYLGNTGFSIWKGDTGKHIIVGYMTDGFKYSFPTKNVRDTISKENIERILNAIEKDDEYGKFAKMFVECARRIIEERG